MAGHNQQDGARSCPACGVQNTAATKFCSECGAALGEAATAPDPLIGKMVLGRYSVVAEIGEGGMGRVYRAEQRMGNATRSVAVKTLHPELSRDPQIVARFQRESETVVQLSHPNTIQFYDFGELPDGTLVIVMEFIKGESLAHTLLRGPISPERIDKILIQICGSLSEAHGLGIVHRDLKPENVLLTNRGGQTDFVKVLDFGIAKRSEAEDAKDAKLTKQGMVLGTPPYMSPEQFSGVALDARSDIYSLGLMTYEMLTGELPFVANTPWEWATKHLTEPPNPIERHPVASRLPPGKRAAVMRALEKDRTKRQQTVLDFLREFSGVSDPQAAWASVATGTGHASGQSANAAAPNDGRVETGQVVARAAVGTPEAMPQTNEFDSIPVAGLPRTSAWSTGRVVALVVFCALLGGGGATVYMLSGDNGLSGEQGGDGERAQNGALPDNTNDGRSAPPPTPPANPATGATGNDGTATPTTAPSTVTTTDGDSENADEPKKGGKAKPRVGSGSTTPAGTPATTEPPVTPAAPTPTPTTPVPEPAPTPGEPSAPPPIPSTKPPVSPPAGAIPAPQAPSIGTGSAPIVRPVVKGRPIAKQDGLQLAPQAPGNAASLEAEGLAAIQKGNFPAAIAALRKLVATGGPTAGTVLKRKLQNAAAKEIEKLIAARRCNDAQTLYRELSTVSAQNSAKSEFGGTCALPS